MRKTREPREIDDLALQSLYLTKVRKELGLSMYDLAMLLDVSVETISLWEKGVRKAGYANIEMLDIIHSLYLAFTEIGYADWKQLMLDEGVAYAAEYLIYLARRGILKANAPDEFEAKNAMPKKKKKG